LANWQDSFNQRQQDIEKRKQMMIQQLNNQRTYQPNFKAVDDYSTQLMKQQQQQQQQTVKKNDSKKKGLLDSLMKQKGGVWGSLQNKAKDLSTAWSDNGGFDLGDIGDTMGMFTGTKPGDVFKAASGARRDMLNDMSDNGGFDVGDIGDLFKHTLKNTPTPAAKIIEAVTTESKKSAQNFTAGVGDVVKGTGQAMTWLGAKNPAQGAMDVWGESLAEKGQGIIDKYENPYDKEFTWSALLDPEFYATSGARSLPFMLSMIVPGITGGKLGAMGANALLNTNKLKNIGSFGKTIIRGLGTGGGAHLATGPIMQPM
jgi:hypothetical protein